MTRLVYAEQDRTVVRLKVSSAALSMSKPKLPPRHLLARLVNLLRLAQ